MNNTILYSVIGFLFVGVIIPLIIAIWNSKGKREDKIITSLDKLTDSLIDYKSINLQDHARIEEKIIMANSELDKRILLLETKQGSTLCPVVTKGQA